MIFRNPLLPSDVFTPRSPSINDDMYIHRGVHERRLKAALRSGKAIIVYGDSGCGKSWLYRKVLNDEGYIAVVVDLNECNGKPDLQAAFRKIMTRGTTFRETHQETAKKIGATPNGIGGSFERSTKSEAIERFDFIGLLDWLKEKNGRKKTCIVFENLEQVHDSQPLLDGLRSIIMMVDDPKLAEFDTKICLVGIESIFGSLFDGSRKSISVSNRLYEVPEIDRMDEDEALELIHRGLVEKLNYKFYEAARCVKLITYYTDRVPQHLQDLCLQVANWAEENNGNIIPDLVTEATQDWLESFVQQKMTALISLMGKGTKKSARTMQVIYAVGICENMSFSTREIEDVIRRHFPKSTQGKKISVKAILNNLSTADHDLVRPTSREGFFRVSDPKSKILLRSSLYIDKEKEVVELTMREDGENYISRMIEKMVLSSRGIFSINDNS